MTHFRTLLTGISAVALLFIVNVPHALAQTATNSSAPIDQLGQFLQQFIRFFDLYLVPLIFALAFIVFLWGVYRYLILGADNEEKRQEGQKFIMYGLIGFFIMISIWGIVNLLVGSLGFGNDQRPNLPTFGSPSQSGSNGSKILPSSPSVNTTGSANTSGGSVTPGNTSTDCRSDGVCPANTVCSFSGTQAGQCITTNPQDCRLPNTACPSGYVCNANNGLCKLNSI
ncbi:MAG: pilin [Patescibacteria group bacterium]